jgi:uncharacterized protein YbaP (TraB family)
MKLRFVFFAVLALAGFAKSVFAFDPCDETSKQSYTPIAERYQIGLLFQIRKCGLADSYIYGTYHSDSAQVWNNAQAAVAAMKMTSTAVFEVINSHDPSVIREAMFFPEHSQTNLRKLIGETDFNTLWNAMNAIQPIKPEDLAQMRPWAAAISLQLPSSDGDGIILDDKLQKAAADHGIAIKALETMREQFAIFGDLTDAQQVTMVKDALEFLSQLKSVSDRLDQAYHQQNLKDMDTLSAYGFSMTRDMALRGILVDRLITSRNRAMTTRAIPYLDQGSTFIAVGALHLMGTQGMLPLLEQQGFYIFPMN